MLSETLRLELEPLGVRVITVMVGIVDTPINAKHDALVLPDNSYYGVIRDRIASFRDGSAYPNKQDPDVTAKNIVHDVVSGSSSYIWRGKSASLAWFCFTFIPDRFLVNMMNGDKGLAEVARAYKSR
jgi:NAD(P)-dependent dehydrogenase (short-subunit alcohol dehydrogenase family)